MLNIFMINPYIRVTNATVLFNGSSTLPRALYDYELIYINNGSFHFKYNDREYDCNEDMFMFIRPGINHSFSSPCGNSLHHHIHFDMVFTPFSNKNRVSEYDINDFDNVGLKKMQPDFFKEYDIYPFITFNNKEKAKQLFYEVLYSNYNNDLFIAKVRLLELLEMIIYENFPNSITKNQEHLGTVTEQIKTFIDADQGLSMTLDDFAKHFSYSKHYINKQFKIDYDINIIAYREKRKFELICKFLKEHSITETSEKFNYSSIYVFSRAFKNQIGISPSDFKKSI